MKRLLALSLALCVLASPGLSQISDTNHHTLRNADVLKMVRAKMSAEVIVAKIKSSRCNFDTFVGALTELKQVGVSDEILLAMIEAPVGGPAPKRQAAASPDEGPEPEAEAAHAPKPTPRNVGGVILPDRAETTHSARFYVAPMDEGFDGYITAEISRRKMPVTMVADEALADYIVVGGTSKGTHKWYDTVFGSGYERDRNQGNIRVVRVSDRTVVWAGEAGDRSLWWGALKKGGRRKVAERLVGKMNTALFKDRL